MPPARGLSQLQWPRQNHFPIFGESIVEPQRWNDPGRVRIVMAKTCRAYFQFKFAKFGNRPIVGIKALHDQLASPTDTKRGMLFPTARSEPSFHWDTRHGERSDQVFSASFAHAVVLSV